MKVSVIVPVYGVEKFIGRCAESLFRQSLDEVEYIFVNDATTDKSMEVLHEVIKKYPHRQPHVHIITHDDNKGLPSARNTGLSLATGEFVFHCDSDDYVDSNMLEELYETASRIGADIVWCDWFLTYEKTERYMSQPKYSTPSDAVKAMLSGRMKYNVWNKLVRYSLYRENNIFFPDGYAMGEDLTMIMLFAFAKNIVYVNHAYYHYVQTNESSLCQRYTEKHLMELKYNIERIEKFIYNHFDSTMENELAFLKLEAKYPFLISDGKNNRYKLWTSWFPEANSYILKNKYISKRSRFIQWIASKQCFLIVWLHYQLIMRFLYAILYK